MKFTYAGLERCSRSFGAPENLPMPRLIAVFKNPAQEDVIHRVNTEALFENKEVMGIDGNVRSLKAHLNKMGISYEDMHTAERAAITMLFKSHAGIPSGLNELPETPDTLTAEEFYALVVPMVMEEAQRLDM